MSARPPPRRSRSVLLATFGAVLLIFAGINLLEVMHWRSLQHWTNRLYDQELASEVLLDQIQRAISEQQLLIDQHIFTSDPAVMRQLEGQLRATAADLQGAMTAFEPLLDPEEHAAWTTLRQDLDTTLPPVDQALGYSRQNRDPEARSAMQPVEHRFAQLDQDLANLERINRAGAERTVATVTAARRTAARQLGLLSLLGVGLTALIGAWTSRLVGQREEEHRHHAAELEHRNRELDAFAGRVAHDLRGPLTAINLATAQLASTPGAQAQVPILKRGVARMEELIADLLTLSRVGEEVQRQTCDPSLVMALVREDAGARLEAEHGTLRAEVEPAQVRGSAGLLRQALLNLVDNALKYRRDDAPAQIEVQGHPGPGAYELRVVDHGLGMSPEEERQAFQPYFRSRQVLSRPGTGLGLTIVKRVVEASGGTVTLQSRPGQGTTFTISLPLASPQPA